MAVVQQDTRRALSRRSRVLAGLGASLVVLLTVAVLNRAGSTDGFSTVSGASGEWAYVAVFGFVVADAICALLPSETVLNAASTLAASGDLALGWVMVAGAAGAVIGDSALYWIARAARPHVEATVARALRNDKVALAMRLLAERTRVLLVVGRYVPGLRFVVNGTLGLSGYPYRRFLAWSAVGGTIWSVYTCALAYLVGTSLAGFPLASMLISGTITTVAIAGLFVALHRREGATAH